MQIADKRTHTRHAQTVLWRPFCVVQCVVTQEVTNLPRPRLSPVISRGCQNAEWLPGEYTLSAGSPARWGSVDCMEEQLTARDVISIMDKVLTRRYRFLFDQVLLCCHISISTTFKSRGKSKEKSVEISVKIAMNSVCGEPARQRPAE